jgi:hypothetical protein
MAVDGKIKHPETPYGWVAFDEIVVLLGDSSVVVARMLAIFSTFVLFA